MSSLDVLYLVFDLNLPSWPTANEINEALGVITSFSTLYLAQSQTNSLHLLIASNAKSEFVWSSNGQISGPTSDIFAKVGDLIRAQGSTYRSGLSSAISKALCHLNRINVNSIVKHKGRCLIMTHGSHASDGYVSLMNAAFCAQKLEVPIDVVQVGHGDSPLLHQAAFLTEGIFQSFNAVKDVMHLLLAYYCGTSDLRKGIIRPVDGLVDFRATCFCHRKTVDIGHVCSVCLSVFCKFCPVCPCCSSKFEFPAKKR